MRSFDRDNHDFSVPKSVVQEFLAENWGRKPKVFKKLTPPIIGGDDLFHAIVKSTREWGGGWAGMFDYYLDCGKLVGDAERFFPLPEDRGLGEYFARISPALGERRFGMVSTGIQRHLGVEFWYRIRRLLKGFCDEIGYPTNNTETVIFAGNYLVTPNGVHRDSAHVFLLPVEGRKRMRLWPRESFSSEESKMGLVDYRHCLKDSIVLEGDPGDILYWPPQYWHVGESEGAPGSSITIGVYHEPTFSTTLPSPALSGFEPFPEDGRGVRLTPELLLGRAPQYLSAMKEHLSKADLDQWIYKAVLNRITGLGFKRGPARREDFSELADVDRFSCEPGLPFLYRDLGKEILISAGGRSTLVPSADEILKLLSIVSEDSRSWSLSELNAEFEGTLSQSAVRSFVLILLRLGALVLDPGIEKA